MADDRGTMREATSSGAACARDAALAMGADLRLDLANLASMCGDGATVRGVAAALAGLGTDASTLDGTRACRQALLGMEPGDRMLVRIGEGADARWGTVTRSSDVGLSIEVVGARSRHLPIDLALRLLAAAGQRATLVRCGRTPPVVEVGPLLPAGAGPDTCASAVGEATRLCAAAFGTHQPDMPAYLSSNAQWDASRAVRVDGAIVGVYLLNEGSLPFQGFPDVVVDALSDGTQVEGVALVTDPAFRGRGYGRLLRDEPARLGYDRVWGYQLRALGNLVAWRRHRELAHETEDSHVTTARLDGPVYDHVAEVVRGDAPSP